MTEVKDSAVIDLTDMEDLGIMEDTAFSVENTEETKHNESGKQSEWSFEGSSGFEDSVTIAASMTSMVKKGQQAWSIYGNIDVLRPYFDTDPNTVIKRLLFSLLPTKTLTQQKVPRELYGPLMIIFTLIALLLFQMKLSQHRVEEGTLIGTAFVISFSYWIGVSSVMWFLAYVNNCVISYVQALSLVGYGLFGHCLVILLSTIIHTTHDHILFYVLWSVIGGLSALRLVTILASRTSGYGQKLVICLTVASLHLLYLIYLHFAYHQTVEGISDVIESARDNIVPKQLGTKLPLSALSAVTVINGARVIQS